MFKLFIALILFVMMFPSCTKIEAGYEGIIVNQYGSDKGVDDVSLTKPAQTLNDAIDSKNKATQKAQQKENELRIAKANAEIMITQAEAEAKANRLKQETRTPLLIQQQFIEK